MKSNSVPTRFSYPVESLYVGDLACDVTEEMIREKFSQVVPVHSVYICRDSLTRKSLGYAYVNVFANLQGNHVSEVEEAGCSNWKTARERIRSGGEKAIFSLNGVMLCGRPMRIMWSERDPSVRKFGKGNVFLKNLDQSVETQEIFDTFSEFGTILSCKVALDEQGRSRGFGFVHFQTEAEAQKAISMTHGMMLKDKKLFVGEFIPRGERCKAFTNVYVKNLGDGMTEERLQELFGAHGNILSSTIMKDANGISRRFGFVSFEKGEDAAAAVEILNGKDVEGKILYVARAQKRAERETQLQQRFQVVKRMHMSRTFNCNLYVKNLDSQVDDEELFKLFEPFGKVTSARVMRTSDECSKQFGFVCYSSAGEAQSALRCMKGHVQRGKPLYVALAQPKEMRREYLNNLYTPSSPSGRFLTMDMNMDGIRHTVLDNRGCATEMQQLHCNVCLTSHRDRKTNKGRRNWNRNRNQNQNQNLQYPLTTCCQFQ